jgi:hypothetical protein
MSRERERERERDRERERVEVPFKGKRSLCTFLNLSLSLSSSQARRGKKARHHLAPSCSLSPERLCVLSNFIKTLLAFLITREPIDKNFSHLSAALPNQHYVLAPPRAACPSWARPLVQSTYSTSFSST